MENVKRNIFLRKLMKHKEDKFIYNEYISSGNYNFNWEGENKSTGIYFFTIYVKVKNNPPTVLSRKMIYLK